MRANMPSISSAIYLSLNLHLGRVGLEGAPLFHFTNLGSISFDTLIFVFQLTLGIGRCMTQIDQDIQCLFETDSRQLK